MNYETIIWEQEGGVGRIVLNRPDTLNAWNSELGAELKEVVERAAGDDTVRAVLLTGAGRAFCSGADLKAGVEQVADDGMIDVRGRLDEVFHPVLVGLRTMPKPVVAAVNGVAAGAGCSLAFACDFRLLSDSAGFNLAFTNIALSCDTGSSWTLPRLVGRAKALELLYFPRTIPAAEALELGLATKVVPADELAGEVAELATKLAEGPTVAYGAVRRAVTYSAEHDFADSVAFEGEMMALTGRTRDHRHAVEAFVAKQKPTFEGR